MGFSPLAVRYSDTRRLNSDLFGNRSCCLNLHFSPLFPSASMFPLVCMVSTCQAVATRSKGSRHALSRVARTPKGCTYFMGEPPYPYNIHSYFSVRYLRNYSIPRVTRAFMYIIIAKCNINFSTTVVKLQANCLCLFLVFELI